MIWSSTSFFDQLAQLTVVWARKRWCQSYVKPFQEGRLQFHWIIKLWSALLLFTFSRIHWLLPKKNSWQQPVPSLVTMTPPNQQCPFRSRKILNWYGEKAELMRQNIWFRNTECIQSDCSILGLSIQGLVSHIISNYIETITILVQSIIKGTCWHSFGYNWSDFCTVFNSAIILLCLDKKYKRRGSKVRFLYICLSSWHWLYH